MQPFAHAARVCLYFLPTLEKEGSGYIFLKSKIGFYNVDKEKIEDEEKISTKKLYLRRVGPIPSQTDSGN